MAEATFRHGSPTMVDYTPGSDVAAGEVVVVDDVPCVAHTAITSGELGAVAMGGGVYDCTADAAIVAGSKVYWGAASNKVTETAGSDKVFGYVAAGSSSSADGDTIRVVHSPNS